MYELRTSSNNAEILKSILCKASHLDNNLTIQIIPYGIQGITNKDIYETILKKQKVFMFDSSIISIYDIEERDVNKFKTLIISSIYIQDIEETYESTSKGKYFLITTKIYYRKSLTEANDMIKYIYPERNNIKYNIYNQRSNIPIVHTNVSKHSWAFMNLIQSHPNPNTKD